MKKKPICYVVELPCNFNDSIFVPAMSGDVMHYHAQSFSIRENNIYVQVGCGLEFVIGVDAFLTYDEARDYLHMKGWE